MPRAKESLTAMTASTAWSSEDYHDEHHPFSFGRNYDTRIPVSDGNRPDVHFTYDVPLGPIHVGDGTTIRPSNTRGFLTSVSDLSGEEHISYDARGRVAWEVKRIAPVGTVPATSYRTIMTHDSSDRLTDIQYPDGTHVSYRYDARSRTKGIESSEMGVIVADQTYTAAGLRQNILFGNGLLTSRFYDPRLRLTAITTRPQRNGMPLQDYSYRYDGAANVLAIQDRRPPAGRAQPFDNSQHFVYDDIYRITSATYDTGHLSFTYDRIGNVTERRFDAADGSLAGVGAPGQIDHGGSFGASDRIGRSADAPGPQAPSSDERGLAYTYDPNGNLTQMGDISFTWDFKDRLVAVESPTLRAEYVYDYSDRRIVKRIRYGAPAQRGPPVETYYVSRYYEVADGKARRYAFDGATRLAKAPPDGELRFYHQDLTASTDAMSNASGTLIQSNEFFPFGALRTRYAPGSTVDAVMPDYLFSQKEHDAETGMLFFEARYLNPELGRFTRVDPAIVSLPTDALENPQLLNGYAYAVNNPLLYRDSSGKWVETVWDVASLGMSISAAVKDPSLLNMGSVVVDTAAVVLPFVPGGAGVAAKGGKGIAHGIKGSDEVSSLPGIAKGVSRKCCPVKKGSVRDVRRQAKKVGLPTTGRIRYIPPRKGSKRRLERVRGGGYKDVHGNVWKRGPERNPRDMYEWDVQLSSKGKAQLGHLNPKGSTSYINVSPRGDITH